MHFAVARLISMFHNPVNPNPKKLHIVFFCKLEAYLSTVGCVKSIH